MKKFLVTTLITTLSVAVLAFSENASACPSLDRTLLQAVPSHAPDGACKKYIRWKRQRHSMRTRIDVAFLKRPHAFADGIAPKSRNCHFTQPISHVVRGGMQIKHIHHALREALSWWEEVIPVEFRLVDSSDEADILIGSKLQRPKKPAYSNVRVSTRAIDDRTHEIEKAIVCLNPKADLWHTEELSVVRNRLVYVFAHETGHALGINHIFPPAAWKEKALMTYKVADNKHITRYDINVAQKLYGSVLQTSQISE